MKYSALSIDVNGIMRYKHGHHLRRHVVLSRPSFLMLSRKVYSFDDAGSVLVFSLLAHMCYIVFVLAQICSVKQEYGAFQIPLMLYHPITKLREGMLESLCPSVHGSGFVQKRSSEPLNLL